jgi:putative glycerol kinase 5
MTGKFVLSADVGTTSLRCHIYDQEANLKGKSQIGMDDALVYPRQGWCEIEPEALWERFLHVCKGAIQGTFRHI